MHTKNEKHAHMNRPVATCIAGKTCGDSIQWCGQQEPCDHVCMMHMLVLSVCDDTRGAQLSSPAVSYVQGRSGPRKSAICALKPTNFSASNAAQTSGGIMH